VFINGDAATGQGAPPTRFGDLQTERPQAHGVVLSDVAFVVQRKDQFQIFTTQRQKGVATLRRRHGEALIKFLDSFIARSTARTRVARHAFPPGW
jgi:hypothetical protein